MLVPSKDADGGSLKLIDAGNTGIRLDHDARAIVEGRRGKGHVQVGVTAGCPCRRADQHVDFLGCQQLEPVGGRCFLELNCVRVTKDCCCDGAAVVHVVTLRRAIRIQDTETGRVSLDATDQGFSFQNSAQSILSWVPRIFRRAGCENHEARDDGKCK